MKAKIITLLFFATSLSAQHKFLDAPKFDDAALSMAQSKQHPNSPAEILYRSIHYRVDGERGLLEKAYKYQIKIYDKEKAEDFLNLEIPLRSNRQNQQETLSNLKAFTHNLENGQKVSAKVEKSSKFKSKEDKYITVNKFAFPNVKNGSVIEYSYLVTSPFLYSIPEINIELDVPSKYTEYVFESPMNISYALNYTGSLVPKHRDISQKLIYGSEHRTYRFGFEDLKPFKNEKFVKNSDNYRTKIKGELHSTLFGTTQKSYSSSWTEIGEILKKDADFGHELDKQRLTREMLSKLSLSGSQKEKADVIFEAVKKNFKWNEDRGIFIDKGFRNLLETKTGNAAEINLFMISMMREAGLDANPVLISTVGNGALNVTVPNISSFDMVLASIEDKGQLYLYDASAKLSSANVLPPRDWNDFGVLFKKDKNTVLSLANLAKSINTHTVNAEIDAQGVASGTYSDKDTGVFAMNVLESFEKNAEKYKKSYTENFGIDFSDIKPQALENGSFESSMKFSSLSVADMVGKKIIVNPMLFLGKTKNDFDQTDKREYQIDFVSPFKRVKNISLTIPEGFKVEQLPKEKKILTDDKEILYTYSAKQEGNKINIETVIDVASADYPKEYYPAFKQIWDTILKAENQVISLTKK